MKKFNFLKLHNDISEELEDEFLQSFKEYLENVIQQNEQLILDNINECTSIEKMNEVIELSSQIIFV